MLPKQGYSSADMPSKCYDYVCCNPCCQRDDRIVNPNSKGDWRAAGKREAAFLIGQKVHPRNALCH